MNEGTEINIFKAVLVLLRAMLIPKVHLAVENLALRQQLAVSKQSVKRPKLRLRDRVFWVWLSRLWPNWRSALAIVQPETVIRGYATITQAVIIANKRRRSDRPIQLFAESANTQRAGFYNLQRITQRQATWVNPFSR